MVVEMNIEERLRCLESQVRRARAWSISATVALGAILLGSMQTPQPKELNVERVVARELRIVDEIGALRAALGPDGLNPGDVSLDLRSADRENGPMARIRVGQESAQLDLGGDGLPSSVYLENDRSGAFVSVATRADSADYTKHAVASLATRSRSGSLTLRRVVKGTSAEARQMGLAEGSAFYFDKPSVVLDAEHEYRYEVK